MEINIIIGEYTLSIWPDGTRWISNADHEGVELNEEELAKVIHKFYVDTY